MNEKARITNHQKEQIVQYLDEARSKHMHLLYIAIGGGVLCAVPGIMLLNGFSGNFYSSIAGLFWYICLIGGAVLFFTGYNKKFGPKSPYSMVKSGNYTCELITVSQKSGSEGRPPYLVSDQRGRQFICPVYLEFKHIQVGQQAVGVELIDGTSYVMNIPTDD